MVNLHLTDGCLLHQKCLSCLKEIMFKTIDLGLSKKKKFHLSNIYGVSIVTGPINLQSFLVRSPVSNSWVLMNKLWVRHDQIET